MSPSESLRERKKRQTRQLLADTATQLFLARGFDGVRVSEIAEACGVSEKTVFNYFPTKEALVMDRLDGASDALLAALADPDVAPVQAALGVLADELAMMMGQLAAQQSFREGAELYRRFSTLLWSTPALRAHQNAVTERVTAEAAKVLAERGGQDPADPEPQIVAAALLALWRVQFRSLERRLDGAESVDQLSAAVTADVHRAATVLEQGLAR
ncbi:TetR family transcriptional regulator [Catenulispora rubra]|uniref:TetR family transcriptional regulator n=1 Tax=Catenulispora rubra TaxID=280293 RepID=UPI00189284FF|nr:TetR family transcriptional regulator [Catenulispora rubra]